MELYYCSIYYRLFPNAVKGWGVKQTEIFDDVICGWPIRSLRPPLLLHGGGGGRFLISWKIELNERVQDTSSAPRGGGKHRYVSDVHI